MSCNDHNIYYSNSSDSFPSSLSGCSIIQLPKNPSPLPFTYNPFDPSTVEFTLQVRVSEECERCYNKGGECKPGDDGKFHCDEECKKCHDRGGECKPGDDGKFHCDEECKKCRDRRGECKPGDDGKFHCDEECKKCRDRGGECKRHNGIPYCDETEKGIELGITHNIWGYT
jgi:hypothetical protein